MTFQTGWRWCRYCQVLFFSGYPGQAPCPAGGQHNSSGSGKYVASFGDSGPGMQGGWKWCRKCQEMTYCGLPDKGNCPSGGKHNHDGSGAYAMFLGDGSPGMQGQWRWCRKCQGMTFAGLPDKGACPAGQKHDHSGSGAYAMLFEGSPAPTAGAGQGPTNLPNPFSDVPDLAGTWKCYYRGGSVTVQRIVKGYSVTWKDGSKGEIRRDGKNLKLSIFGGVRVFNAITDPVYNKANNLGWSNPPPDGTSYDRWTR